MRATVSASLILVGLVVSLNSAQAGANERPNIVVIFADDK